LEAQGERLLQELISYEQALLARVEAARQEAEELLGQAEVEAQAIAAEIDQQIARLNAEQTAQARRQAEEVRLASLAKAEAEVARLEARSQGRLDEAVKLVLERVLP
jgi:vacuolar-type H+-ATPase subunit H